VPGGAAEAGAPDALAGGREFEHHGDGRVTGPVAGTARTGMTARDARGDDATGVP
jgi:hypothetical protein